MAAIPIMRPMLPVAERLAIYLNKIDAARVYSNFGPLTASLEERIASHFRLPDGAVATVANGTLGLWLALLAQAARPGTLCVLPAWTFIASVQAAMMAGLTPFFVDVDARTWALEPAATRDAVSSAPAEVGAVMPVAPFGQPVDIAAWDDFRASTGLAVVIDAAAGFDSVTPGQTPTVVSLHATKVLGAGEGGFVIATDHSLIRTIRAKSNFGFQGTREARSSGGNAKLSEYHAAVGHASLDEWARARAQWMTAANAYRTRFSQSERVHFQQGFGQSWISSTCVVNLGEAAARVETELGRAQIATRRWWGDGAHAHTATRAFPRTPLPVTETLARTTISIPFFRDIESKQIGKIGTIVLAALDR
jgi:dTDP-4-amino-4,6-dideoxygalactose transaminase